MTEPRQPAPAEDGPEARRMQMRVLVLVLTLLGLWIARGFLLELAWAGTMAIALWPLYCRFARPSRPGHLLILAPLGFTLAMGLVLMLPLAIVAVEAARDSQSALGWVAQAQKSGVPTPAWLHAVPFVGARAAAWWQAHLADPRAAAAFLGETDAGALARWTGALAAQVASRSMFFLVTLLALFVILRDGRRIAATCVSTACHFYGDFGERFMLRLADAVRGAVNGTVFVAIGEGTLIGFGYAVAGVPRPVLFTLATIAVAMLPFGAWFAFGIASLVLLAQGHLAVAIALFVFGAAVMLVGDNLVQPALVGNTVELPFLWTFVATFGGLQTFGFVGLFIGPAAMAALFLVWREWLGEEMPAAPRRRRGRLRRGRG
ncbi:MAG TPA: AI-2E family transporter [Allosphingosinicella sp.]|jgi:predicted PurR-regulated permease PerM